MSEVKRMNLRFMYVLYELETEDLVTIFDTIDEAAKYLNLSKNYVSKAIREKRAIHFKYHLHRVNVDFDDE